MMLAREALSRLAADVPRSHPHNLHRLTRFLQRAVLARNASNVPAIRAASCTNRATPDARRSYATAVRAKKPAKATKTTRTTKSTTTAKKPVRAKAVTKTTTKAAPKRKAAPAKKSARKTVAKKRRVAKKKPAPKKRVKKVLTPEAKEKLTLSELRKKALKEPVTYTAISAINAYVAELCSGPSKTGDSAIVLAAEVTKKWKTLPPAEREHYQHLANEKTAAKRAKYTAWIRTHTPEEIRIANNARANLRRRLQGSLKSRKYPTHTSKLLDDRRVKPPLTAYILFAKARMASGDFKSVSSIEAVTLIGKEWKALSASEKKKYEDAAQADKTRASREKAAAAKA